jgi:hypothetical protein
MNKDRMILILGCIGIAIAIAFFLFFRNEIVGFADTVNNSIFPASN